MSLNDPMKNLHPNSMDPKIWNVFDISSSNIKQSHVL